MTTKDKASDNQSKQPEAVEKPRPLDRSQVRSGQGYIITKQVLIPHGVTLEQALDPEYWEKASQSIKVGYELRLDAEDETWVAWTYVHKKEGFNVFQTLIKSIEIDGGRSDEMSIDGYKIKWNGPGHKWVVIDRSGNIIFKNHASRNSALKAMENIQRAA